MKKLLSGAMLALLVISMLASTFMVGTSKLESTGVNAQTQKSNPYSQTFSEPPPTEWNKTYGGRGTDHASALLQTSDGGYALAGGTTSFGGNGDFWLVKTDSNGNAQWNRTYEGAGEDHAYALVQTSDGGYALAGETWSFDYHFGLLKTDASGNMLWNSTYIGRSDDIAYALVQASDGGYALAGDTQSFGAGDTDFWLIKVAGAPFTCDVTFSESDLAVGAQWSVHLDGPFVHDAHSSTSSSITFVDIPNGVYDYSVAATGFIASPTSGSVNVTGPGVTVPTITFNIAYATTAWDNSEDGYACQNPKSDWSPGNCYGLASTAVLYFMHQHLSYDDYPYYPSQSPTPASTWDLDLSTFLRRSFFGKSSWWFSTLNNASLAVTFHQAFGQNFMVPANDIQLDEDKQYGCLLANLTDEQPVVLYVGYVNADGTVSWEHAVVAWSIESLVGPIPYGRVGVHLYDSNHPGQDEVAIYDLVTHTFSYGDYNRFLVIDPTDMLPDSSPNPFAYPTVVSGNDWIGFGVLGYWMIVSSKQITLSTDDGSEDYFTSPWNSQTFVKGITGSSGIMEGGVQVYAYPDNVQGYIQDPGLNQSTIMIIRVDNESGRLVGYGYLLNATSAQGDLSYTVTPSASGLSISVGNNALNASVTFFCATEQDCSFFQASNIPVGAMQTANFAVSNWQTLNDTGIQTVIVPEFPVGALVIVLTLSVVTFVALATVVRRRKIRHPQVARSS